LKEMRGELLAGPSVRAVARPAAGPALPRQEPIDPLPALQKITEALRREKPALASALEKVESAARDGEELVLTFSVRDRFQGEVVQKDREMLTARLAPLFPGLAKLRLAYREVKAESARVDQRVELLKKVFRGEIVKGEGHGDQSV
jgi:hypothetical protein